MIDPHDFDRALGPVRDLVQADGGDLVLDALDGDEAQLRLVLEDAECRECVMPRQFLEKVALDMMRPSLPTLARLVIDDPRETE